MGTRSFFLCGKDGQKVRDCPSMDSIGREGKEVPLNAPKGDAPKKKRFYALQITRANSDEMMMVRSSILYFVL